ncbi:MAG: MipA/OmpV family protein [Candidatus Thiodiazotropha sp. (ex Epidulcina cf. delphinae)]|nr:MipA/OmpV family protein [Candidatus Thiodiazotropha sp. (ex Epidulcina cf. delphinae)]
MFAQRNKQLFISFISALAATLPLASQEALAGEWSVGASILGGRNPIVGEGAAAALLPVVGYKGERFYANLGNPGISFFNGITDFGGLGYSVFKGERYNIDLVGKIRAMGIDPDDNSKLDGLDERKPGFDAGVSARWDSGYGELSGQLLTDVSNRSKGQEAVLSYAYPMTHGNWTLRPELGVSWQSRDLVDYYFGVESDEATATRSVYEGESTVTPFAGIQVEYAYSQQIHLIGGVGIGRLGDGISDSPIVDERGVGGGYAGLVYRF